MHLNFEKWHGNLNDFILSWVADDRIIIDSIKRQAERLCVRDGSGIGADGLILLIKDQNPQELTPSRLEIINKDGSIAKTCGNGIRCAALSILKRHYDNPVQTTIPDGITLNLLENSVDCQYISQKDLNSTQIRWPLVNVNMGEARLNTDHAIYDEVKRFISQASQELNLAFLKEDWAFVELANQHLVFFTQNKSKELLRTVGTYMQSSSLWDGINVHIVSTRLAQDNDLRRAGQTVGQINEEIYDAFVWERGVGETASCGSGACAIGVAALKSGFLDREDWVAIDMPGGSLYVKQNSESDSVSLSGPASLVFEGSISI